MRIEIIAIGDELLDGRTRDANTHYLGGRLRAHGATLARVTIVDDTRDALPAVFKEAADRADLVLTSGGLGPTLDDRTREAIAEAMGVGLRENEASTARMKAYFARLEMEMPELNIRQAMMPEGAIVHANPKGTADAFETVIDGTPFISLPGVPYEFNHLVENIVLPRLSGLQARPVFSFHVIGRGESDLARTAEKLGMDPAVKVTWSAGFPSLTIELSVDPGQEALLDDARARVEEAFGPWMFTGESASITGELFRTLEAQGATIATAESCTGGLLASTITDLPGASRVFNRGYVTYANEAKCTDLGVRSETLEAHGAVSQETALEMVRGARMIAEATLAIAITGIAGPDGGTPEKPVGRVFIACETDELRACLEIQAPRVGRTRFKRYTCEIASLLALRMLQGRVSELADMKGVRNLHLTEES